MKDLSPMEEYEKLWKSKPWWYRAWSNVYWWVRIALKIPPPKEWEVPEWDEVTDWGNPPLYVMAPREEAEAAQYSLSGDLLRYREKGIWYSRHPEHSGVFVRRDQ